jgi:hypothetical protein
MMLNNTVFYFPLESGATGRISFFPRVTPGNTSPGGQVFAHSGTPPTPLIVIGSAGFHVMTGPVTGSTGPSSKLTLSTDQQSVCAENRTGFTRAYTFHVVNSGG